MRANDGLIMSSCRFLFCFYYDKQMKLIVKVGIVLEVENNGIEAKMIINLKKYLQQSFNIGKIKPKFDLMGIFL